jgi:hypothetical protein
MLLDFDEFVLILAFLHRIPSTPWTEQRISHDS